MKKTKKHKISRIIEIIILSLLMLAVVLFGIFFPIDKNSASASSLDEVDYSNYGTGKNLFNINGVATKSNTSYTINNNELVISSTAPSGYCWVGFDLPKLNGIYTISVDFLNENGLSTSLQIFKDNNFATSTNVKTFTYSFSPDSVYAFRFLLGSSIPIGTSSTFKNIQIEKGSTATEYEPYRHTNIFNPSISYNYGASSSSYNSNAIEQFGYDAWIYSFDFDASTWNTNAYYTLFIDMGITQLDGLIFYFKNGRLILLKNGIEYDTFIGAHTIRVIFRLYGNEVDYYYYLDDTFFYGSYTYLTGNLDILEKYRLTIYNDFSNSSSLNLIKQSDYEDDYNIYLNEVDLNKDAHLQGYDSGYGLGYSKGSHDINLSANKVVSSGIGAVGDFIVKLLNFEMFGIKAYYVLGALGAILIIGLVIKLVI